MTTPSEAFEIAVEHHRAGRLDAAAEAYREAIRLQPGYGEAHNNLGTLLKEQGQLEVAMACYRAAIASAPEMAEPYYNLGIVLATQGRTDEALDAYRAAIDRQPNYVRALVNYGSLIERQGRLDEALACYDRALAADPGAALAHLGRGNVLHLLGDAAGALECYQRSLRIAPDFPESHHNLALLHLSQGRFAEAWPEFAWRTRVANYPQRTLPAPLWQGEDLHGRTVLVHAEQGLGDTLMLLRYLPLVKSRGGRVLLEVQPRLMSLLKSSGCADIVARGSQLPPFDLQTPILNLPALFGTVVESIPGEVPYLTADRKLVDAWREKLTPLAGFKVGIGWQGSRSYAQDRTRSIPLAHFAPLAAVSGVQLISLQKADGREQLDEVATKFTVHDLGPQLDAAGAFVDTAAVIENLDLVITSDTALAHLAGALAAPTWVALAKVPEWRWLVAREDSPWYPTMRLFRQQAAGDWPQVFARLADQLQKRVASAAARPN